MQARQWLIENLIPTNSNVVFLAEQEGRVYHQKSKIRNNLLFGVLVDYHNWGIPKNTGRNRLA
jgi:hypothetical protein